VEAERILYCDIEDISGIESALAHHDSHAASCLEDVETVLRRHFGGELPTNDPCIPVPAGPAR
jgi:hypothetical protein